MREDDFEWVIYNDPQIGGQEKYDSLIGSSLNENRNLAYEESETLSDFRVAYEFTIINKD